MLKHRIITATILIVLTLAILFYLPMQWFLILTAIITLAAAWEWTNLMGLSRTTHRVIYLAIFILTLITALATSIRVILWCAFIWWLIALIMIIGSQKRKPIRPNVFVRGCMGILVLVPCWVAINYIRSQEDGIFALLFLFILIWGADTAAYFVGKKWGTHKLASEVSPGKSVEGFVGALCFSLIIAVSAMIIGHVSYPAWIFGIGLALLTVIFSVIGDLFESMIKRIAGLKDSGNLLPGHGGLLDRLDSLTAAAPVFALGATLLGDYLA